jgi:hypothetical protein
MGPEVVIEHKSGPEANTKRGKRDVEEATQKAKA